VSIRIYEFSKQINVPNKIIIDSLKKGGFEAKSHMSFMTDEGIAFVKKNLDGRPAPETPNPEELKKDIMQKNTTPHKKTFSDKKPDAGRSKGGRANTQPRDPQKPFFMQQRYAASEKNKVVAPVIESVVIEPMTPAIAALKMGKSVNEIIMTLLGWGMIVPKNQMITEVVIGRLADQFGLKRESRVQERTIIAHSQVVESQGELQERLPVVVVVGHVDHGKTSLLDYIRKTRVAAKEKGGITQHIGAYEASTRHGNIIFLDTPGHEAFSKIRQRGIRLADIAILIVAADDGIMPQTAEAIKHIKAMNVPIVVAINKVDKVEPARIEAIKQQLSQYDLLTEDWGGQVLCVPISAKTGAGVDELLELLVLQAHMLELRANPNAEARGYILESEIEKGRGAVATLICQHGSVHIGDFFVCGKTVGHVTSLVNSHGARVESAGPSIPVRVAGFEQLPEVGDYFEVIPKELYLSKRSAIKEHVIQPAHASGHAGSINLLIKVDTNSTLEALMEAVEKVSKKSPVPFHIVYSSVGSITESDVELAYNTGCRIVGLHTRIETKAALLAQQRGVIVELYDIIYKMLETLQAYSESKKVIEYKREKTGTATVLKVFDIKKLGIIAGCMVNDGTFVRKGIVVAFRRNAKVGEGKITSLQRDKKTVKEVHSGFECGFIAQGFQDWQEGDTVECYIEVPKP
jgi:translation initiation factor IF-2